jgi:hypothetical protein
MIANPLVPPDDFFENIAGKAYLRLLPLRNPNTCDRPRPIAGRNDLRDYHASLSPPISLIQRLL